MDIRSLRVSDVPNVQLANLTNLPENYFMKYYLYHALSWPQLSYVAVDTSYQLLHPKSPPKIVGYVLAKMDEDNPTNGHITSLSVMRTYRRLGLAEKLMRQSTRAMREYYKGRTVSLHVRVSNEAALALYTGRLGFEKEKIEGKYYADSEDAWSMRLDISKLDEEDERPDEDADQDEGAEVGDEGKAADAGKDKKERLRKVKVGRGLGVGELVEKNESQKAK